MPAQRVEPYVWGFIGTAITAVLMLIAALVGYELEIAQPLAGGFFTGWLAGHLWNWSGRKR